MPYQKNAPVQQPPEMDSEEWWNWGITTSEYLQEWAENEIARLKEKGVLPDDYTLPDGPLDEFRTEFANKSAEDIEELLDSQVDSKEKFEDIYNLVRSQIARDGDGVGPKSEDEFEDKWYHEGERICPAWREESLSHTPEFSLYLLATTDMSVVDVLDENKRRAAARNLPEDNPYWNLNSNKKCRLEFQAAPKLVSYFQERVESLLKEKGRTLTPADFCTSEFTLLNKIMPRMNDATLQSLCSPEAVQPIWSQEARKNCVTRPQAQMSETLEKKLDQMAAKYATTLAERSNKASEFLDYCQQTRLAPNQEIPLHNILRSNVYVAAYWHQFCASEGKPVFNRIPSEADMGCDFLNFTKYCKQGVLKDFDFKEINKLEQDLTRVCSEDSKKAAKLEQYAEDGTLFRSIQIESEDGHLRATVADSLYRAFGLTPPQRIKPKPMSMGGMGGL